MNEKPEARSPKPEAFADFVEKRLAEHRAWREEQERIAIEECVNEILAATAPPHEC